jgi:hypothetical protein
MYILQIEALICFLVFEMASCFSPQTIISKRCTTNNRIFKTNSPPTTPFHSLDPLKSPNASRDLGIRHIFTRNEEPIIESSESLIDQNEETITQEPYHQKNKFKSFSDIISDKVGQIDETRLAFPEIANGEVDRVFR